MATDRSEGKRAAEPADTVTGHADPRVPANAHTAAGLAASPSRGAAALVVAAAAALALPSLSSQFVLDDAVALAQSACVSGELDLARIITSDLWCTPDGSTGVDAWRPLPVLLWALLSALAPGSALLARLLSILAHVLCVERVIRVASAIFHDARVSLVAGATFAVAAIHTEAFANAVGSCETLSALAVWSAVVFQLERPRAASRWLVIPLLCAVAFVSKESGVVAPVLVALAAWRGAARDDDAHTAARPPSPWMSRLGPSGTAVLVVAGLAVVRAQILGGHASTHLTATVNPLLGAPWWARAISGFDILGRYHRLFVTGTPLSADYSYAAFPVASARAIPASAAIGALIGAGLAVGAFAWAWRTRSESMRFVASAWLVTMALPSNLFVLLPAIFAERLFYSPSVPVCLALGVAAIALAEATPRDALRRVLCCAGALWLLAQAAFTVQHALAWRDERSITETTVAATPTSARAQLWLARACLRDADVACALECSAHALEILPGWAEALAIRGIALDLSGQPEAAFAALKAAFDATPHDAEVADLFAQFLRRYGHVEQAQLVEAMHEAATRARAGRREPN